MKKNYVKADFKCSAFCGNVVLNSGDSAVYAGNSYDVLMTDIFEGWWL